MSATTVALPPTVADLKSWSRVDFAGLDNPYTDEELQVRLDRACAFLLVTTGRAIDETMPAKFAVIAQEAVQLRVEQMCFQEQQDYSETANDELIQTFSAGNYSETRRTPSTAATLLTSLPEINPNPWLNRDLWLLCTDEMAEYWLTTLGGQAAAALIPSFEVTEADWGNYDGLYPYSLGAGAFRQAVIDATVWGA